VQHWVGPRAARRHPDSLCLLRPIARPQARVAALLRTNPAAGAAFCRGLIAPLLDSADAGAAASRRGPRVPVPLERVLALAASIGRHLADHAPAEEPRSPPRKSRARRDAPKPAGGASGKRKKVPAGAAAAGAGGEEGGEEEEERDVVVAGAQEEGPEGWAALLGGLAELATGLGAALKRELCECSEGGGRGAGRQACRSPTWHARARHKLLLLS
jgi:hypothetical protein